MFGRASLINRNGFIFSIRPKLNDLQWYTVQKPWKLPTMHCNRHSLWVFWPYLPQFWSDKKSKAISIYQTGYSEQLLLMKFFDWDKFFSDLYLVVVPNYLVQIQANIKLYKLSSLETFIFHTNILFETAASMCLVWIFISTKI